VGGSQGYGQTNFAGIYDWQRRLVGSIHFYKRAAHSVLVGNVYQNAVCAAYIDSRLGLPLK